MADIKETCIEWTNDTETATISSNEIKWINKINKYAIQYPNDIQILYMPDNNYGTIFAHVSKNFIKLSPPRAVNYTEEQKVAAAERMAKARQNRRD